MPRGVTRSPARRLAEKFKTTKRISNLAMDAAEEEADDLVEERLKPLHTDIQGLRTEVAMLRSSIEMNAATIEALTNNHRELLRAVDLRIESITRAQLASFAKD